MTEFSEGKPKEEPKEEIDEASFDFRSDPDQLSRVAADSFRTGPLISIEPLPGYYERNFLITTEQKNRYVMKVAGEIDPVSLDFQNQLLLFLSRRGFTVPVPQVDTAGHFFIRGSDGSFARLLEYIEAPEGFPSSREYTQKMLREAGRYAGALDRTMTDFLSHEGELNEDYIWNLKNVPKLQPKIQHIANPEWKELVQRSIRDFEETVLPEMRDMRTGIIHGDLKPENLIFELGRDRVAGVIDFGDSMRARYPNEIAILMAHLMQGKDDLEGVVREVYQGYLSEFTLTDNEQRIIPQLIMGRLATLVAEASAAVKNGDAADRQYVSDQIKPAAELMGKLYRRDLALIYSGLTG